MRWFLLCSLVLVAAAEPAGLTAGAASIDITPPVGYPLWGYAARHDAACKAVHDSLRARALVLGVGDRRVALVSLDLGRPPGRVATTAIRTAVAKLGVAEIFLVASHTHHGPVLELDDWPKGEEPYTRRLQQQLIAVITSATEAARPARFGLAATATALNRNRHSRRADAPRDDRLTVLRVETLDGKPIAHAVHFAAHPTMRPAGLLEFSADYVGPLAQTVERATGVPCLFLQGAAGDLSPNAGDRTPERFGKAVGEVVLAQLENLKCTIAARPTLHLHREELPFAARVDVGNPFVRLALGKAFFPALVAAYEREYREGVRPQLTVALLDDRLGLVGISGEPFCGHALSLRRRARLDHALLLGYCNGYHQYFPTIEAASEGGYGAEIPVALAELGAGERLVDRGLLKLYEFRAPVK